MIGDEYRESRPWREMQAGRPVPLLGVGHEHSYLGAADHLGLDGGFMQLGRIGTGGEVESGGSDYRDVETEVGKPRLGERSGQRQRLFPTLAADAEDRGVGLRDECEQWDRIGEDA